MSTVTHVMSVSLVPADAMAALKLRAAIDELRAQDPTLGVTIGPINEIMLHGLHEAHLDYAVTRLQRGKELAFTTGSLEIQYREGITSMIEWDHSHKKQTGGTGEYAKVRIRFQPREPGSGFQFANETRGEVPPAFVPAVERGLFKESQHGPLLGFPLIDLSCTLVDGGYHDVDSSERTFEIAPRACPREALPKARPRVLEPMMHVAVLTPQDYMGDVIGDLNSRHGQVQGMETRGTMQEITALVPFANLLGYVNALMTMTHGSAQFTMAFSHYEQVPALPPGDGDNFPPAIGKRA